MREHFAQGAAFYKSDEWRQLSLACRERDGYMCKACFSLATTPEERRNMQAHHLVPRPQIPYATALDVLSNLETRCSRCHGLEHGRRVGFRPAKIFRASSSFRRRTSGR